MIQRLQRLSGAHGVREGMHFAVAGALLFTASLALDREPTETGSTVVSVSAVRIDQARDVFVSKHHRAPTDDEIAGIVRHLVNQEILFRHALSLGLDQQEPVQRRLAQIATFVSETPEATSRLAGDDLAARAEEAKRLGLHHDDVVVRRILVDSATRLIRGAVLAREPSEEALREHLARQPDRFREPETLAFDWRYAAARDTERRAQSVSTERRAQTKAQSVSEQSRADLARRFGRQFLDRLDTTQIGEWQGPIASRNGTIEVRVTRHRPERTASLDEVRAEVGNEVMDQLADRWLEARLDQLRVGVEVELPQGLRLTVLAEVKVANERSAS